MKYSKKIGMSPAGVEWVAYKPEDVKPLSDRLAVLWARHEARKGGRKAEPRTVKGGRKAEPRTVKVKLTPTQHEVLLDIQERGAGSDRDLGVFDPLVIRRTYVQGTPEDLSTLAAYIEGDLIYYADTAQATAEDSALDDSWEARGAFAWRSAYASLWQLWRRLQGKSATRAEATRVASSEWRRGP